MSGGRLNAGTLRDRVSIQALGATQDGIGQPVQGWTNVATGISANVRHLSGIESIKANAETSILKASIRIRWRTNVTPGMRVLFGTKVYDIQAVLPDYQYRDKVDLSCEVSGG